MKSITLLLAVLAYLFSVKSFSEQKLKTLYFYVKAFAIAILLFKLSFFSDLKKEPKNLNFYVKSTTVQCCFINNAFFFFSVKPFSEQELKTLNFYVKSFAILLCKSYYFLFSVRTRTQKNEINYSASLSKLCNFFFFFSVKPFSEQELKNLDWSGIL